MPLKSDFFPCPLQSSTGRVARPMPESCQWEVSLDEASPAPELLHQGFPSLFQVADELEFP